MIAAELDAVTIDAYGTLMTLVDPLPALQTLLPDYDRTAIEHAFRTEAAYYAGHVGEGRDAASLARLHETCVALLSQFLRGQLSVMLALAVYYSVGLALAGSPTALPIGILTGLLCFIPYVGYALGLTLAVVGNWDYSLHRWLAEHGLAQVFATVVSAAGKPDPAGILQALDVMRVPPARALHIGDDGADEQAARAAGVHFARAPLPDAVAGLT